MTEHLAAVLTPTAILSAILTGLVFGAALPWLFARLTEPFIPDEHAAALNRAPGLLIPFLAIPLGAAFWLAQIVTEIVQGGPWPRLAGRFLIYLIFVAAVTIADLLVQRLVRPRPVTTLDARFAETEQEAQASRDRLARLLAIEAQVTAQTARRRP